MAAAKSKKTGDRQDFFTPKQQKRREEAARQNGDGSPPASPGPRGAGLNSDIETLSQKMETLLNEFSATLTSRLDAVSAEIRGDIRNLGERTSALEDKMAETTEAHNIMAARVDEMEDRLERYANKIADLEDRSRRHNLKIRGIPESVSPRDLRQYVTEFLSHLLPDATMDSLLMDRVHRIPKPPSAPPNVPRDVILRLHYFKPREDALRALRTPGAQGPTYAKLSVFPDLSQATLQRRRQFRPITDTLRLAGVSYRWGYPTKILILKDGVVNVITSPEQGRRTL
uniref:Uncharacterized protein n=1 Tax=Leptobrachium leishanense TaxID=445787 RepID=A0A8C5PMH8_9ANUR